MTKPKWLQRRGALLMYHETRRALKTNGLVPGGKQNKARTDFEGSRQLSVQMS